MRDKYTAAFLLRQHSILNNASGMRSWSSDAQVRASIFHIRYPTPAKKLQLASCNWSSVCLSTGNSNANSTGDSTRQSSLFVSRLMVEISRDHAHSTTIRLLFSAQIALFTINIDPLKDNLECSNIDRWQLSFFLQILPEGLADNNISVGLAQYHLNGCTRVVIVCGR